jgi:RNase H-like domain found in reverse transcriptase/Reverse transcriptase (RNA-dependent DNA polymerase)
MPFGPCNAPPVYTAMMQQFEDKWEALFDFRFLNANPRGCRVIVDDILLWSSNIPELLGYLKCVVSICMQYRLSLKLSKCDFLKERIEYVGHDLTPVDNCPAKSKYTLIDDWSIPTMVKSLHSFICLCNFYSRYCPWFEVTLKPFRTLVREQPSTATIPTTIWSPSTTALYHKLKQDITSSPCIVLFDRHKPVFLKTDYSALGMALALMQPDDSDESRVAMLSLHENQDCDFDTTLKGARLRPIKFHSRRCLEREQHYHSFVGEAATGRWSIGICHKYLVGQHFFWLCDCSAMKEILEYTENIH